MEKFAANKWHVHGSYEQIEMIDRLVTFETPSMDLYFYL